MKTNWRYICLFLLIAFGISAPVHLGYCDAFYASLTKNSILSEYVYLLACAGPLVAGIIALLVHKSVSKRISIWGDDKLKYKLVAVLPLVAFFISGLENTHGMNVHVFGLFYATINVLYAVAEEFGWRYYLQNALEGINKHWKYIIIGIIWWLWHMRFETQFDLFVFPLICIGGGYLLGKLADDTKSIIPVVTMHTLIILLTNSGSVTTQKVVGVCITIVGWIIIEEVWKRRATKPSTH